ncbi:MAG: crotonase/enoyl-CoA hydratase family protein [Candidatus Dormiibacterota bacterium]
MTDAPRVVSERRGHVFLIKLNRADKRNAVDRAMYNQLAVAYAELDNDPEMRVGVLHADGDHFTGGLDLTDWVGVIESDGLMPTEGGLDPLGITTNPVSKPVVIAVQGRCLTIGIELMLASDIRVAARDTRFAQIEVKRGIFPTGGATWRFFRDAGWGNAMRYILTGDEFGADDAFRMGLVQELVAPGEQLDRAIAIAEVVAAQAPLAVAATLASARLAEAQGYRAVVPTLVSMQAQLIKSEDAREGVQSFIERRTATFSGR